MLDHNVLIMPKKEEENHDVFNLKDTPKPGDPKPIEIPSASLQESFAKDRADWKNKILRIASLLKDMHKIVDVQVELYSERQIALEHNHYLMSLLSKINKDYRKGTGAKFNSYMKDYDRKMKQGETSIMVEADMADMKEKVELLDAQIEYFRETIRNIDNIIYGIRYRIQVEEYRTNS